jgi:hypothetical protein
LFLLIPAGLLLAQTNTYVPLVGVPGVTNPALKFGDYINALYALSISVAALMAVIKIIIAGMKWMLSDVVTNKSEAISEIRGAVLGLLIVISAVLILNQINPQLTETNIFIDPVKPVPNNPVITTGPTTGIITGNGLSYVKTSEKSLDFEKNCKSAGSSYAIEAGGSGGPYEACYAALSGSLAKNIDDLYKTEDQDFGAAQIKEQYQTTHIPKEISVTSIDRTTLRSPTTQVHFAVSYKQPGDFIDQRQPEAMSNLCFKMSQAMKAPIYLWGDATRGYYACVQDATNAE